MSERNSEEKKRKGRERKKRYRARHYSFTITVSLADGRKLNGIAQGKRMNVPEYVKALIFSSQNSTGYVLPKESNLLLLLTEIKRIGTNVNQTVRFVNYNKELHYRDVEVLQNQLAQIQNILIQALKHPPELIQLISRHVENNPEILPALMAWLQKLHDDYKNSAH